MISVEEARERILADLQPTLAPKGDSEKVRLAAEPSKTGAAVVQLERVA